MDCERSARLQPVASSFLALWQGVSYFQGAEMIHTLERDRVGTPNPALYCSAPPPTFPRRTVAKIGAKVRTLGCQNAASALYASTQVHVLAGQREGIAPSFRSIAFKQQPPSSWTICSDFALESCFPAFEQVDVRRLSLNPSISFCFPHQRSSDAECTAGGLVQLYLFGNQLT